MWKKKSVPFLKMGHFYAIYRGNMIRLEMWMQQMRCLINCIASSGFSHHAGRLLILQREDY